MFQCKVCSESPFTQLFGQLFGETPIEEPMRKFRPAASKSKARRDETTFEPRTEAEVKEVVGKWLKYVHPRAQEYFRPAQLEDVLARIARSIERTTDPVLMDDKRCTFWYGDVMLDGEHAAIRLVKPGEELESVTFVNRLLAFIFAVDESFEELMQLPRTAFKMSCGDQLCIHVAHISLS